MNSAICTLFEGHYHLGLASLVNSLVRNEYKGPIYAGYKGKLPYWIGNLKEIHAVNWENSRSFEVNEDVVLHFLPLETGNHFANYKPDFMLQLWQGIAKDSLSMFYFDPDIVVVRSWLLFEEWSTCGIALSEDVNSPLSKNHPRRVAWRRHLGQNGIVLNFKENIYVNSGFVGVVKESIAFIELWQKVQKVIAPLIGGLDHSIFKPDHLKELTMKGGAFSPFITADQDALNIAIEASEFNVSFIGKSGMGFENGFILMEHAIGSPKPWKLRPFKQFFDGRPPRNVDYAYWKYADGPIYPYTNLKIKLIRFALRITALLGRFYKRK